MLLFPKQIFTASGAEITPQSEDVSSALKCETITPNTPIAVYPRTGYEDEKELISAAVQKVMTSRKSIHRLPEMMVKQAITNITETFPKPLADHIFDLNADDETVRAAVASHFEEKASTWMKSFKASPGQHLLDSINAGDIFTPIWEDVLPQWLTIALEDVPILIIPVDRSHQEDYGGAVGADGNITAIRYQTTNKKSLNASIIFEEALHIAQGQSPYWREHFDELYQAAIAFKKRISKRDEEGHLDQSSDAKRPRQHLKRNSNIDDSEPFWKYDKAIWADELIVDMALIEAQLLAGAHNGRPRSQEKVNEIMAERFPEMYKHYRAFMDDVINTAVTKLEDTDAEKEQQRQAWTASPMGDFAKQTYKKERSGP
jgi:hypothetical protein